MEFTKSVGSAIEEGTKDVLNYTLSYKDFHLTIDNNIANNNSKKNQSL